MEFFLIVCLSVLLVMILINRTKQKEERREDQARVRDLTTRIYFLEGTVTKLKHELESGAKPTTVVPPAEVPPPPKPAVPTPVVATAVKAPPMQAPVRIPSSPPAVPPEIPLTPPPPVPSTVASEAIHPEVRHEPFAPPRPVAPPQFATVKPARPPVQIKSVVDRMEDTLGRNWLGKIGISLVVLGVAFFLALKFPTWPAWGQALVGFGSAALLLGGGIWLERRDRYRILARALIGGGWALLFFLTWAVHYIPAVAILESGGWDFLLMFITAVAMVLHTLHYRSQAVTGLAYLLAFLTVGLNHADASSLIAGVLLAGGLVVIVGRYQWYELEVFGILASYLNHYLWLRPIIEPMQGQRHPFPEFTASAGMLVLYWLIYRMSYVFRKPADSVKERISSVAALVNPALLMALLKYQSIHPEWAFWGLLAIGSVETLLGQLQVTRRRRTAVVVLSTLGVVLLIAAFPFRYSGANLSVLWLLEAEALVLIGIWSREIVFRRLGLLAALLVSGHMLAVDAYREYMARAVQDSAPPNSGLALVFAVAAIVFYANAHWISRRWAGLFTATFDRHLLQRLSYVAALMAFIAAWLAFPEAWTAVAWCALAAALAWAGRRYSLGELFYQGNVLSAAGVARALVVNLESTRTYGHVTLRLITLSLIAVLLYLTAHWSWETGGGAKTSGWRRLANGGYTWTASSLLAVLAWYELHYAAVAVVWAAGALVLALVGRRLRKPDLIYQGNAAAIAAIARAWLINYDAAQLWHGVSLRLITVTAVAVLLYVSSRWSWVERPENLASRQRMITAAYTWAGTALLAVLAWYEVQFAAVAVVWAAGGLVLALVAQRLANRDLTYQANGLAAAALVRAVMVNYSATQPFHGMTQRLASVMLVAVLLYVTSRWSWAEESGDREFFLGAQGFPFSRVASGSYIWAGSFLLALLAWYELRPVGVAVAWVVGGLLLLELGLVRDRVSFRAQAYVAFVSAFLRIFFVNLNASGEGISPRLYTVAPIALALFYAYWRLRQAGANLQRPEQKLQIPEFCCWLGTVTVAALLRFELQPDWVATGWAALALALLLTAWMSRQRVFLHQALLLSFGILFRTVLHNFYQRSYFPPDTFWQTRWVLVGSTVVLMFLALPMLFRLRSKETTSGGLIRQALAALERRPEQLFFFIAVALLSIMLGLEMRHGMVTLAWGLEGVAIFLVALWAGERSFRLTGLALLMVCVAKILLEDIWRLQLGDRYLTLVVLGGALVLVSFLYTRYSEKIRQFL